MGTWALMSLSLCVKNYEKRITEQLQILTGVAGGQMTCDLTTVPCPLWLTPWDLKLDCLFWQLWMPRGWDGWLDGWMDGGHKYSGYRLVNKHMWDWFTQCRFHRFLFLPSLFSQILQIFHTPHFSDVSAHWWCTHTLFHPTSGKCYVASLLMFHFRLLHKWTIHTSLNTGLGWFCQCQSQSTKFLIAVTVFPQWLRPHPSPSDLDGCSTQNPPAVKELHTGSCAFLLVDLRLKIVHWML